MAKADILSQIYAPNRQEYEFNFNTLVAPPLLSMITLTDIGDFNYLVESPKYASKIEYKYKVINEKMAIRGFRKLHAGTNRVVYVNPDIPGIVIKICTNSIALTDAPNEYNNQFYLAPFVAKTFEYSPCGTVGVFERVDPITSRQEFLSIADSIFELINKKIIGIFVLEDIGTKYFMNWGIRRIGGDRGRAWGPVILDYPTMFRLDGKKLFCNRLDPITGKMCTGVIDYDAGANHLICPVCGKQYQARQLAKYEQDNSIIIANRKGEQKMEVVVKRGKEVVSECNTKTSKVINQNKNKIDVEVVSNEIPVTTNNIQTVAQTSQVNQNTVEDEINLLKFLFAKYPVEGASIIQDKLYTLSKLDFENGGVDRITINGIDYIKESLLEDKTEDLPEVTEDDFDDNGKFIVERRNEEKKEENHCQDAREDYVEDDEKVPFISSKKTSKY